MPKAAPVHKTTWDLRGMAATEALAVRVARHAVRGDVIGLSGPLGAGKTTLARFFIAALGGTEEVPSPTFSLVQTYPLAGLAVWHFDLYRIQSADDVFELGIEEALAEGISLIEWPENMADHLPDDRLEISLTWGGAVGSRCARLSGHGGWGPRLGALGFCELGLRASNADV